MEKAVQNWSSKELIIVALMAIIAVGVIVVILIATNIIPVTKTVLTSPAGTPVGGGAATPSPGGTNYTSEQRAGTDVGAPVVNPVTSQQPGVKCSPSCCLKAVTGAGKCSGSNQTYYEQECYSYPDYANSVVDCENQKTTYYMKCGVCPQASCSTALC